MALNRVKRLARTMSANVRRLSSVVTLRSPRVALSLTSAVVSPRVGSGPPATGVAVTAMGATAVGPSGRADAGSSVTARSSHPVAGPRSGQRVAPLVVATRQADASQHEGEDVRAWRSASSTSRSPERRRRTGQMGSNAPVRAAVGWA